jgi:hypothetical protein
MLQVGDLPQRIIGEGRRADLIVAGQVALAGLGGNVILGRVRQIHS